MPDDAISALLPLLVGGGGASTGGTGMGNPDVMGALQAMQTPYAQGVPSNAGPIGQIAQALMPLVAGPAYAQQARQQQAEHQRDTLVKVFTLIKEMKGVDLQDKKLQAEAELLGVKKENMKHFQTLFDITHNDPEAMKNVRTTLNSKGEMSMSMGGEQKDTELGLIRKKLAGDPGADAMLNELATQKRSQQQGGSDVILRREKDLEQFKRDLPPKITDKQRGVIEAGNTLLGLLGEGDKAISSIPKDVGRSQLALQAAKYQGRSEHPALSNLATGLTGGLVSTDTDPRLDQYFSWIGQTSAALASFNLEGLKGGFRTLQWLRDHFPGYGDSPESAQGKVKWLSQNKAIVKQRIEGIQKELHRAASAASDVDGVTEQGWVGRDVKNKAGEVKRLWMNPTTGESKLLDPSQAPPLE